MNLGLLFFVPCLLLLAYLIWRIATDRPQPEPEPQPKADEVRVLRVSPWLWRSGSGRYYWRLWEGPLLGVRWSDKGEPKW